MASFKRSQTKTVTGFLGDMAKGLMLGAIIGQWSIPDLELIPRVSISITWAAFSLLSLYSAIYLAKYE